MINFVARFLFLIFRLRTSIAVLISYSDSVFSLPCCKMKLANGWFGSELLPIDRRTVSAKK